MNVLIDNGHGENTAGKRSPDGRLREYAYTREIAKAVCTELRKRGYPAERIVRETVDVPLRERVARVNEACRSHGTGQCLLVSIHCNAAGNGSQWMGAKGWSAYTCKGQTKSDRLASCLYDAAKEALPEDCPIRMDQSDSDEDWEENFYILKHTRCAAVLTENLFQDNKEDVEFLLSVEGRQAVVELHVEGIVNFIKTQEKK